MNAAEANVACSVKHGGRPAVFVSREELNEVKIKFSSLNAWTGICGAHLYLHNLI